MMKDTYIECTVACKPSAKMRAAQIALILLTGILLVVTFFVPWFFFVAAAVGFCAFVAGKRIYREYDYFYMDKTLTVVKVFRTKRKKPESFSIERMELLAPVNDPVLRSRHIAGKIADYSDGYAQNEDQHYMMIQTGGEAILLQPSKALLEAIHADAPWNVHME